MLTDIQEDVDALVYRLAERGYRCRVKETGRGAGVTLFIHPDRPPRDREPGADDLRAACLAAFRDAEHRRVGRDGVLRVRLRDVARRLGCGERATARALDGVHVTVQRIGGRTWIVHDEHWNRFGGRRTPVLA